VRVTFTCEKCGHVLEECVVKRGRTGHYPKYLPYDVCPACAKLIYGPLTVELVAEALYCARYPGNWRVKDPTISEDYYRMARFVLRLLKAGIPDDDYYRYGVRSPEWWRDWILDLAKQ